MKTPLAILLAATLLGTLALLASTSAANGMPIAMPAADDVAARLEAPARSGEQVVQYQCVLCHGQGLSGAPKIGDGRAWGKRAPAGIDGLVQSASRGRGAMPPRGGLADLTDPELRAAIAYMLERSGVKTQ